VEARRNPPISQRANKEGWSVQPCKSEERARALKKKKKRKKERKKREIRDRINGLGQKSLQI
jgi:hypothetical protein